MPWWMQWVQLSVGLDSSTLCSQVLFSRYSGFRLTSKTHSPDFATFLRFESQLSHNTGNFTRYSFRIVFAGSLTPHISFKHGRYCKTVPTVYSPYPRTLESLTMCRCMGFHPRQNSMLHFTFHFSHFILHLLFDLRVYTFVIQLSSCNIQVLALYIHLFVGNVQVHVQVQRVVLPSFRIQC